MIIETRELLEDAYVKRVANRGQMLTHSVLLTDGRRVVKTLCGVSADSVADAGSMEPGGTLVPPTCKKCSSKFLRLTTVGGR